MVTVSWLLSYKRLRKYFRIIVLGNLCHFRTFSHFDAAMTQKSLENQGDRSNTPAQHRKPRTPSS